MVVGHQSCVGCEYFRSPPSAQFKFAFFLALAPLKNSRGTRAASWQQTLAQLDSLYTRALVGRLAGYYSEGRTKTSPVNTETIREQSEDLWRVALRPQIGVCKTAALSRRQIAHLSVYHCEYDSRARPGLTITFAHGALSKICSIKRR